MAVLRKWLNIPARPYFTNIKLIWNKNYALGMTILKIFVDQKLKLCIISSFYYWGREQHLKIYTIAAKSVKEKIGLLIYHFWVIARVMVDPLVIHSWYIWIRKYLDFQKIFRIALIIGISSDSRIRLYSDDIHV
jgi:hypothetical protein